MSKLEWDAIGKRYYEMGVSQGVLYLLDDSNAYSKGVAWNGLTSITESPSGAEPTDLWADNIKYATLRSAETFSCTVEAYTYPDEWAKCDGSAEPSVGVKLGQQTRVPFGLSYVTQINNDTATDTDDGYLIHLIYGGTAAPSERPYQSINDSPEAITFSWEIQTVPVNVTGYKPTSSITINSFKADKEALKKLEDIIWGTADEEPRLPLPNEVLDLFKGTPVVSG